MIICFSGTGNSRLLADWLQDALGDEIIRLAPGFMLNPEKIFLRVNDRRVIWLFPTHCWHMPKVVREVIASATFDFKGQADCPHYMIATCGDDIGLTAAKWRRAIQKRGWRACSAFSVQMPNTYVALRSFDLDPQDVANAKLETARARAAHIVDQIVNHPDSTATDVVTGSWPWVKTEIVNRWFTAFMQSPKPFYADHSCNGCGRCARNCPVVTISMKDGRPTWKGKRCIMCLRCYHYCPNHSIQYGSATAGKGQYRCPGYVLKN